MNEFVEGGYIILSRKLLDSKAWNACTHEQKTMLITTLLKANHKEALWWDGGENILIPRGSFATGRKSFSILTNTSEGKVRCFWKKMKKVGFLTIKATNKHSIITICNYDCYQNPEVYKRPSLRPSNDQGTTTNNNVNNIKEIKYSSYFQSLWNKYPKQKRIGMRKAFFAFNNSVKTEEDRKNIEIALKNYCSCNSVRVGYIKDASTWFCDWECWVDYKEPLISEIGERAL